MPEIPEPGDRAIVGWIDANGDLYAVFHRTDAYADDSGAERWYNADQYATVADPPLAWGVLVSELSHMTGPYLLNVGELLGGTDG